MKVIFYFFIFLFICSTLNAYPETEESTVDPRIKSHKLYKLGYKEFMSKKYVESVVHVEQALKWFPRHKKARELLQDLRVVGTDCYNTGVALIYFNKDLSTEYLNKASKLLDPKDLRRKKIARIIERLEHSETHHQYPQEQSEEAVQDKEEQDS